MGGPGGTSRSAMIRMPSVTCDTDRRRRAAMVQRRSTIEMGTEADSVGGCRRAYEPEFGALPHFTSFHESCALVYNVAQASLSGRCG